MCDFSDELKRIVFSDMTDEEKEEAIKYETAKENIVGFLDRHPEIGVSFHELGLTEEDFINAPAYEITDKDIKMDYSKEEFAIDLDDVDDLAKPTPLYRYESYAYGASGYGKNSRRFCRDVATRSRTSAFRYVDILRLNGSNPGFGSGGSNIYSVFLYRGGSNCKHFWVKYYYQPKEQRLVKAPTTEQPTQIHKGDMPPPKK